MIPLLVGEQNTRSDDPRYALFPLPRQCAGGRLAKILGLPPREYLRRFDRVNILPPGRWAVRSAREQASRLTFLHRGRHMVLLGAKVCDAFGVEYRPFEQPAYRTLVFPHPSGRCRIWNDPASVERARAAMEAFYPAAAQPTG